MLNSSHLVAKPLVMPAFHEARRSSPAVLNLTSQPRQHSHSPDMQLGGPASCHILPNQLAFQQVTDKQSAQLCCQYWAVSWFQHLHSHAVYTVRPYICQLCDAGFTSLQQLDSHSRLHTAASWPRWPSANQRPALWNLTNQKPADLRHPGDSMCLVLTGAL